VQGKKGDEGKRRKRLQSFSDEDIQKGEYVIEYTGKIVYKDPDNE
jgi:hypothetical protein